MDLSFDNVIVATTSACAHENLRADYVILSLGKKHEDSHGALRITFSKYNTKQDVDELVKSLKNSITRIRKLSSFSNEYSFEKIKNKNAKCKDCDKLDCEVHK
jgi:cysteine desulfurase